MRRRFMLPLLALCFIVPATAQVLAPQVMRIRPPATVNAQQAAATRVDPASDPTLARAEIDRLTAKNHELRRLFQNTLTDLQTARHTIDEMTRTGGSLVTAHCASPTESRNTAGASEDCSASGYACAEVTGLCHRSCQTTDMCAPGFLCDTSIDKCVVMPS